MSGLGRAAAGLLKVVLGLFAVVLALIVASYLLLSITGGNFGKHPDDSVLIARLPEYQRLLAMYQEDRAGAVDAPEALFHQGRIDAERWSRYQSMYQALGLVGEPTARPDGSVWIASSVRSVGTAGSAKGLVYRPGARTPLYGSLDEEPPDLVQDVNALRRIDDDWFIFYRYNQ